MAAADQNPSAVLSVEPLMSIDEVARVLRISPRGVYRLMRRGQLESLKVGGRTLLEPDEVRRFIASQRRCRDREEERHETP
jgi:excisionase family DNA binding protein